MKHIHLFFLLTLTLVACDQLQQRDRAPEIDHTALPTKANNDSPELQFVSHGNDMGDIVFTLNKNESVALTMDLTVPEGFEHYAVSGTYKLDTGYYTITFENDSLIPELFGTDDGPDQVHFYNDSTIAFAQEKSSLWIWGVRCEDTLKNPVQ